MTFLLDVNVLIALLDEEHVFHDDAHAWFDREGSASWATCSITENGVMRIVGSRSYPNNAGSPAEVAAMLDELLDVGRHSFWQDDVRLLRSPLVQIDRLLTSGQITDSHLLFLALSRGGKLATFDRRLSTSAVRGGEAALHVIGKAF